MAHGQLRGAWGGAPQCCFPSWQLGGPCGLTHLPDTSQDMTLAK